MEKLKQMSEVMFTNFPDCVSVDELQEMLGIKRTKAYEMIKNKEIKAIKLGRDYKIPKINVIAFLIGGEQIWQAG